MLKQDPAMVCPKCGSAHFQDVQFNQYRKGLYSEIPVVAASDVEIGRDRRRNEF